MLTANLIHTAGDFCLDARLEAPDGVTAIFGPSGCGKTTLLNLIAGLQRPTSGIISLDGEEIYNSAGRVFAPPEKRRIGYVFQDLKLMPHMTIRNNLLYGFKMTPAKQRRFTLGQIADLLEIGPLLDRRPSGLSGGEAQRVAIGRAILASPRLLLLDEPFAALDQALKNQIFPFLRRIHAELRVPMIYVSHAMGEILELTHHLAVMEAGKIIACGDYFELLQRDEVYRQARRLGLENLIEVEVTQNDPAGRISRAKIGGQTFTLPLSPYEPGRRALVGIRPEDIILARQPVSGLSAQNCIAGKIIRIDAMRDFRVVRIDVGQPFGAEVTQKAIDDLDLKPGQTVYCLAKTVAFRWHSATG